jgi:hypothetical protein
LNDQCDFDFKESITQRLFHRYDWNWISTKKSWKKESNKNIFPDTQQVKVRFEIDILNTIWISVKFSFDQDKGQKIKIKTIWCKIDEDVYQGLQNQFSQQKWENSPEKSWKSAGQPHPKYEEQVKKNLIHQDITIQFEMKNRTSMLQFSPRHIQLIQTTWINCVPSIYFNSCFNDKQSNKILLKIASTISYLCLQF